MRILLIHNRYRHKGGEDVIFEQEVSILKENGFLVEILVFDNEELIAKRVSKKISIFFDTLYNKSSAKIVTEKIREFNPDVVHIHNIFYKASPSVIIAVNKMNIPIVMTLHNYRLICSGTYLMRDDKIPCEQCIKKTFPLDGILHNCFQNSRIKSIQLTLVTSLHRLIGTWKKVDQFIVLTEFAKDKILESSLRLDKHQVVVKPNSVVDLGYDNRQIRSDYYLFVGRLSPEKGIDTLIEASEMLSNTKIKIIGDGPMKNEVINAVKRDSSIDYLGPMPRDIVIDHIKKCKALIVSSIWYEGLPTVILEALSTGTPIICADNPNLRSILNEIAVFFTPNCANSLKEKIEENQLLEIKENISMRIRRVYEAKYTQLKVFNQQMEIYRLVVNKKSAEILTEELAAR